MSGTTSSLPMPIRVWMALTSVAPGLLGSLARRAHRRQGGESGRFGERLGRAGVARGAGPTVWLHAASVGEVVSVVRLAQGLAARGVRLLVTTATVTGAATVARLLPEALHQFVPIDTPGAVAGFLDHWQPDAALFVEGDLWPRMVLALEARGCPMVLLNARASRSRARAPAVYARLLAPMRLVTVQDEALIPDLRALGVEGERLQAPGNLKADGALLAVDEDARAQIARAAEGRAIWAAVSTHEGEEEMALAAHLALPGAPLLLLVPRHPVRGDAVEALCQQRGLSVTRRSRGEAPGLATAVHLVDVLGETGTVYAAAGLAFVGGSLVAGPEGHTPYEPVGLGCAVLAGPHVGNFAAAYAALQAEGAAVEVADAAGLRAEVAALLADGPRLAAMQAAARRAHEALGGGTQRTLELLARFVPVLAGRG